jgi:hypothetical protein
MANMKFVLLLPVSGAAGWAADGSWAYRPGRLWPSPGRGREADGGFAQVSVLAWEEPPAPLNKTPGRQEK